MTTNAYLHAKDYGAIGDGVADDTTSLQSWIAALLSSGMAGWLDPGIYKISSALTVTGANPLSITGPGVNLAAVIKLSSTTQDGIVISGTNRVFFKDFGIQGAASATAGAAIHFSAGTSNSVGCIIDNIFINQTFMGIQSTGMSSSVLSRLQIDATSYCMLMSDLGDSTITESYLTPVGANASGIYLFGDVGGVRIANNKINGANFLLGVAARVDTSDGDLLITGNSIEGHKAGGYGILIGRNGSPNFNNVVIGNNQIAGAGHGFVVTDTTAGWIGNMTITGNVINLASAGHSGISLAAGTNFVVANNNIFGSAGTGVVVNSTCAKGLVANNIIIGQTTAVNNGSTSSTVINNVT